MEYVVEHDVENNRYIKRISIGGVLYDALTFKPVYPEPPVTEALIEAAQPVVEIPVEAAPPVVETPIATKKQKKRKRKQRHVKREVKEAVLERDMHKCARCGGKERLHVHHIFYRALGGTDDLKNLTTLCSACHADAHAGEPVHKIMTLQNAEAT